MNKFYFAVKYEYNNGTHSVHVEDGAVYNVQVRNLSFPDSNSAIKFVNSLNCYSKLKTLEELRGDLKVAV